MFTNRPKLMFIISDSIENVIGSITFFYLKAMGGKAEELKVVYRGFA